MALRFDPKTGRVIVGDLTPSVKGEIVTLQNYADAMLWNLQLILEELEKTNKKLDDIKEYTSNLE